MGKRHTDKELRARLLHSRRMMPLIESWKAAVEIKLSNFRVF